MPIFSSGAVAADLKIFGEDTESTDITELLTNTNAEDGWGSGVDPNGFPAMSWFNAVGHTLSYITSYYLQKGIAEWVALQEYFIGSQVVASDGFTYTSKTNNNTGNTPVGDTINWKLSFLDSANTVVYTPTADYHPATKKYVDDNVKGKILQVVSVSKTDTFSSSAGFTDITGLAATITPASASSKIMVMVDANCGGPANQRGALRLLRGATPVGIGDTAGSRNPVSSSFVAPELTSIIQSSFSVEDSPATTSPTTYKVQGIIEGSQTFYLNRSATDIDDATYYRPISSITLLEIGV